MSSQNPEPSSHHPAIWLDAFPIEICTKIASFLPLYRISPETGLQQQDIPDAFSLAAVSANQQAAVAAAQSSALSIEQVNNVANTTFLIRHWREILHTIHEVTLPMDVINNDDVENLLSLPTIHKAVIPNYSSLLRALCTGRSVKFLELSITMYCPANGENGLSFGISEVLRSCPVEKLCLLCSGCYKCPGVSCSIADMLRPMQHRKCLTLRSLHLKCSSERMEELMTTSSFFPNLEEFRLEHWIAVDHFFLEEALHPNMSEEIYEDLRRIEKVEMIHCGSVDNFIPHLGSNLRGLSSITTVRSTEVVTFGTCPNLQSLDIVLEEGAEVCFPQNLCRLTSISLTWNPKHRPSLHEQYYTPVSESLPGLIQRNKEIGVLRLKNAKITSSLLSALLSTTSSKLRILSVPIFHQGRSSSLTFSTLVELIVRYNPCLKALELGSVSFGNSTNSPMLLSHESGICDPNTCEFCDLRRKIEFALCVLKRRLVRFCDDGLQKLLSDLEPWR